MSEDLEEKGRSVERAISYAKLIEYEGATCGFIVQAWE